MTTTPPNKMVLRVRPSQKINYACNREECQEEWSEEEGEPYIDEYENKDTDYTPKTPPSSPKSIISNKKIVSGQAGQAGCFGPE